MIGHLRNQPKGLYSLFFTELWERFGFYTVQAIIILYMTKGFGYSDKHSYLLYGTFTSLIYLTPFFGGYLADRFFGFKQSILIGGVLLICGYAAMSIRNEQALFLGMSIVVIANGFFKPNVSSMVGDLYTHDDPRREGGYTLFYMGINIGAMLPPLFIGPLVDRFGWNWGFLVASVGMTIGLITFLTQRTRLHHFGKVPTASPLNQVKKRGVCYAFLIVGVLLLVGVLQFLFYSPEKTVGILIGATALIVCAVIYYLVKEPPEQRRKLWASLILIAISIGFWSIYVQTFTSLMLFADRNMSKEFLGFTIDAEFTQFFNPFFIILLSPILSGLWVWLSSKRKNPSIPAKFSLGILFMALGFLLLGAVTKMVPDEGLASPWWLVSAYFLQTTGELLLSPIGLAMITRLAPHHLVGMMMGVWMLSLSASFAIGGTLATWASVPDHSSIADSLRIYSSAFTHYGLISLTLAIVGFALIPYINKLIKAPAEVPRPPTA